jgi:cell division protein FtsB
LETEISDLKQQVTSLEGRNNQLSDLIGYFQSSEYREKEARSKLNLQRPGEHVVVIPQAESRVESAVAETTEEEPSNIVKWWNYFFGI